MYSFVVVSYTIVDFLSRRYNLISLKKLIMNEMIFFMKINILVTVLGILFIFGLINHGKRLTYQEQRQEIQKQYDEKHTRGIAKSKELFNKACDGNVSNCDYAKVKESFEGACKSGDKTSCSNLGVMYQNGWGVKQDIPKGESLLYSACKVGNELGCDLLGETEYTDDGYWLSKGHDLQGYTECCENGVVDGCSRIGLYYRGGFQGIDKDEKKAKNFFQKACDEGNANGCFNLGTMYLKGDVVKQDYSKTIQLYKKACENNEFHACFSLGDMYSQGIGTEQNRSQAKGYYKKSCEQFGMGCVQAGIGKEDPNLEWGKKIFGTYTGSFQDHSCNHYQAEKFKNK